MARCGCGGAECGCNLVAGDNVLITGSGSGANPWVVNATIDCADVRPCISAQNGATYNPATGVIEACVSPDADNALTRDANGCLFVQTGASTVVTGCGLTGTGAAGNPVRASTGTWPYACDLDDNGSFVFCGGDGVLRGLPPTSAQTFQSMNTTDFNDLAVPTDANGQTVYTRTLTWTNPDPCRTAYVLVEIEADAEVTLPPGGSAALFIAGGDKEWRMRNNGATTLVNMNIQAVKVFSTTVGPGVTRNDTQSVDLGLGAGGATYSRIQLFIRNFVWLLS